MGTTVTTEIGDERVASLLCCAFEGGVGYWCRIFDYRKPAVPVAHLEGFTPGVSEEIYPHVDYPLCDGGAVLCYETETDGNTDERFERDPSGLLVLDRAAIERGLRLMPTAAPKLWGRFLAEDEDSDVGDCFVQLALLGKVVY